MRLKGKISAKFNTQLRLNFNKNFQFVQSHFEKKTGNCHCHFLFDQTVGLFIYFL